MAPISANQKLKDPKNKKQDLSRASSISKPEPESPVSDANGNENPYLKDLQKYVSWSLRSRELAASALTFELWIPDQNISLKQNATSKVDTILAENPDKSLDELVAEKKINADQKAQALKKPSLQATISQIEEQIGHYKQFAAQCEERLASQKAALEKTHREELDVVRGNAIADATEAGTKVLRERLLTLSKFLCAAANMRRDGDAESLESRAFEGVLFQVYGGSQDAVNAMVKLIDGADEKVLGVEGETLELNYGDVKQASNKYAPVEETPSEPTTATVTSDPTLANAGLTELQDTSIGGEAAITANVAPSATAQTDQVAPPAQTLVSDAANPVAESTYNPNSFTSSATTNGLVEIPRDPAETDTGLQATPATVDMGMKNNPTAAEASGHGAQGAGSKAQSGGRGRGGRGRGRGEGFRGRGRGDFRGRGRGGRGGRGRGGRNSPAGEAPAADNQ
ncbi:hypothetical protein NUU61_002534 [Penicillium alfredii]|uniref:YAG7-like dimerisation domain-containing protein n=1 Tax=Penicillium alfredii TaxID=1506179 RepID=A0A9W9FSL7_9EURO|nr:uncharacterized protein NUU61_002534 [Penicillium alfredii]KAJ5105187.1 hypothetical protein NUU61_002534 [Penicillium alfredii]